MGGHVFTDTPIDAGFDIHQGFGIYLGKMRKVKAQSVRCHQRTGLLDMLAKHLAQHRMQNVGRRMIQSRRLAHRTINIKRDLVSFFDLPGNFIPLMDHQPGGVFDGVHNFHFKIFVADFSGIPDLTAGSCIKRRFLGHQFDGLAGGGFGSFGAVRKDQLNL